MFEQSGFFIVWYGEELMDIKGKTKFWIRVIAIVCSLALLYSNVYASGLAEYLHWHQQADALRLVDTEKDLPKARLDFGSDERPKISFDAVETAKEEPGESKTPQKSAYAYEARQNFIQRQEQIQKMSRNPFRKDMGAGIDKSVEKTAKSLNERQYKNIIEQANKFNKERQRLKELGQHIGELGLRYIIPKDMKDGITFLLKNKTLAKIGEVIKNSRGFKNTKYTVDMKWEGDINDEEKIKEYKSMVLDYNNVINYDWISNIKYYEGRQDDAHKITDEQEGYTAENKRFEMEEGYYLPTSGEISLINNRKDMLYMYNKVKETAEKAGSKEDTLITTTEKSNITYFTEDEEKDRGEEEGPAAYEIRGYKSKIESNDAPELEKEVLWGSESGLEPGYIIRDKTYTDTEPKESEEKDEFEWHRRKTDKDRFIEEYHDEKDILLGEEKSITYRQGVPYTQYRWGMVYDINENLVEYNELLIDPDGVTKKFVTDIVYGYNPNNDPYYQNCQVVSFTEYSVQNGVPSTTWRSNTYYDPLGRIKEKWELITTNGQTTKLRFSDGVYNYLSQLLSYRQTEITNGIETQIYRYNIQHDPEYGDVISWQEESTTNGVTTYTERYNYYNEYRLMEGFSEYRWLHGSYTEPVVGVEVVIDRREYLFRCNMEYDIGNTWRLLGYDEVFIEDRIAGNDWRFTPGSKPDLNSVINATHFDNGLGVYVSDSLDLESLGLIGALITVTRRDDIEYHPIEAITDNNFKVINVTGGQPWRYREGVRQLGKAWMENLPVDESDNIETHSDWIEMDVTFSNWVEYLYNGVGQMAESWQRTKSTDAPEKEVITHRYDIQYDPRNGQLKSFWEDITEQGRYYDNELCKWCILHKEQKYFMEYFLNGYGQQLGWRRTEYGPSDMITIRERTDIMYNPIRLPASWHEVHRTMIDGEEYVSKIDRLYTLYNQFNDVVGYKEKEVSRKWYQTEPEIIIREYIAKYNPLSQLFSYKLIKTSSFLPGVTEVEARLWTLYNIFGQVEAFVLLTHIFSSNIVDAFNEKSGSWEKMPEVDKDHKEIQHLKYNLFGQVSYRVLSS